MSILGKSMTPPIFFSKGGQPTQAELLPRQTQHWKPSETPVTGSKGDSSISAVDFKIEDSSAVDLY